MMQSKMSCRLKVFWRNLLIVFLFFLLPSENIMLHAQTVEKVPVVYVIKAHLYPNDSAVLENITSSTGIVSFFPGRSDYLIEELDSKGAAVFSRNIQVSFNSKVEGADWAAEYALERAYLILRLPAHSNATAIKMYHKNRTIMYINLSKELCNKDGECNLGENEYNCPPDCQTKDNRTKLESKTEDKKSSIYPLYGVLLILAAGILVYILNMCRKAKKRAK